MLYVDFLCNNMIKLLICVLNFKVLYLKVVYVCSSDCTAVFELITRHSRGFCSRRNNKDVISCPNYVRLPDWEMTAVDGWQARTERPNNPGFRWHKGSSVSPSVESRERQRQRQRRIVTTSSTRGSSCGHIM